MISIKMATFATILLFFAMKIGKTQPIRNSDPIHTILCFRMRDESNTRRGNFEFSHETHVSAYNMCEEVDQHFDGWGG